MIKTTPFEMVFIIRDKNETENNGFIALSATSDAPGYDASCDQPMPEAGSIMLASDKLLIEEASETLNPFIIVSCILLALAAAGWGLFIKQRWFSKKSDA